MPTLLLAASVKTTQHVVRCSLRDNLRRQQGYLQDLYGVEVSAALISEVTDSVLEEAKAWRDRPLEALYPIVYLDALMVKMRHDGKVENRAIYTAIGINMEGLRLG